MQLRHGTERRSSTRWRGTSDCWRSPSSHRSRSRGGNESCASHEPDLHARCAQPVDSGVGETDIARWASSGAAGSQRVRRIGRDLDSTPYQYLGLQAQRPNDGFRYDAASKENAMNQYKLPDLPYDYGALEPHVSGKIMELHHDKHHAGYVNGANAALERLDEARTKEQFDRIPALERSLAFNLSGHILHSIFWRNLSPQSGGEPTGELKAALERDFGGFAAFRRQLNEVAGSIMGSGWAALVWEPLGARLLITQIYDHQSNLNQTGVPLLVLDAWEHAYYLQYQNRKAEFFGACWNVFNWPDVARRLEAARKLRLDAA